MTTTTLYLRKRGEVLPSVEVTVPRCPIFDFDNENSTAEVRELLARGYVITGHADQPTAVSS